jgi:hypothetical protein
VEKNKNPTFSKKMLTKNSSCKNVETFLLKEPKNGEKFCPTFPKKCCNILQNVDKKVVETNIS